MDGFRRMLWNGHSHSADHIPVSALRWLGAAHQQITLAWWELRHRYELLISDYMHT